MDKNIIISIKTIFITLLMILAGYVIYRLKSVIGILLVAVLLVVSLEPAVKKLMKLTLFNKPVKRSLAVIVSYAFFVLAFIIVGTVVVPPVLSQAQKLFSGFDQIVMDLERSYGIKFSLADVFTGDKAASTTDSVITFTFSIFSNVSTFFSLLVISIYLSLDWPNLKRRLYSLLPPKAERKVSEIVEEIEVSVGSWVKGEFTLMLVIGVFSFLGLVTLDVKYPLALGLVSGLLEIVPIIGPVVSAILAAIVGFADDPLKGAGVLVLFIIIQQLENNLLVPKIMQRVSGFSPLIILLALLIGSEFFGIAGAILAVPMTMILAIIMKSLLASDN